MILHRSTSDQGLSQAQAGHRHRFPFHRRRPTSFDDAVDRPADGNPSRIQEADVSLSKKKPGFWQSRLRKLKRGRRASRETRSAISKKVQSIPSRLKRFLHKLRSKAKDARAIRSSNLDLHSTYPDVREEPSKSTSFPEDKQQRLYSVHPEPMPVRQRQKTTPLWERRSSAHPPTLDLRNLKVTGLKHLSLP